MWFVDINKKTFELVVYSWIDSGRRFKSSRRPKLMSPAITYARTTQDMIIGLPLCGPLEQAAWGLLQRRLEYFSALLTIRLI